MPAGKSCLFPQKLKNTALNFDTSAQVLGKRKKTLRDEHSVGPGFTIDLPMPDWTRHILKLRRRAGLDPVSVPGLCRGLEDAEIEEDLSFLHLMNPAKDITPVADRGVSV